MINDKQIVLMNGQSNHQFSFISTSDLLVDLAHFEWKESSFDGQEGGWEGWEKMVDSHTMAATMSRNAPVPAQ